MNGKGSKARPFSVPYSKYADNFDQINWGKKPAKKAAKSPFVDPKEYWDKSKGDDSSSLNNPGDIVK